MSAFTEGQHRLLLAAFDHMRTRLLIVVLALALVFVVPRWAEAECAWVLWEVYLKPHRISSDLVVSYHKPVQAYTTLDNCTLIWESEMAKAAKQKRQGEGRYEYIS